MTQRNLAWRSNLEALRQDWEAGEISEDDFFEAVIDQATPETAAETLVVIGEEAASRFDLLFTARHGDRIPPRREVVFIGHGAEQWKRRQRVLEAFHRAILERREPL